MEALATVREVLMIEEDWRIQFIDFIKEFKLPPHVDPKSAEAARIIRRSKGFVVVGDNLYKRSASGILMKCVTLEEGKDILKEIHEGVCGNHTASRTLVGKAYRSSFFGQRPFEMQKTLSEDALATNSSAKRLTSMHKT